MSNAVRALSLVKRDRDYYLCTPFSLPYVPENFMIPSQGQLRVQGFS